MCPPQSACAEKAWYIFDRRLEQNTLRDLAAARRRARNAGRRAARRVYVGVWSLLALTLIAIAGGVLQSPDAR